MTDLISLDFALQTYSLPEPRQLLFLFASLLLLAILLHETPINLWVSNLFWNETEHFYLKNNLFFSNVLHDWGRYLLVVLFCSILAYRVYLGRKPDFDQLKLGLSYMLFCWVFSVLTIVVLKTLTTLPCPWNVQQFGGDSVYLMLREVFSQNYPAGRCFPSAHASGAYGLMGLAYFAAVHGKSFWAVALSILTLGALYGGVQVARGAHFISHDIFTLLLCWLVAALAAPLYLKRVYAQQ